jgi:hypothetical protein
MYISMYYKCLYIHMHVCSRFVNNAVSTSDLSSSPNVIKIIKSKSMKWAGHVARMERSGMHTGFWWESQKEDLNVEGNIILQ